VLPHIRLHSLATGGGLRRRCGGPGPASAWAAGLVLALASPFSVAQSHALLDLSIEELANLPITSVSRRAEPLRHSPASIYVISGDAVRRSTAQNLPQALRLAPNLQVAQQDAGQYAITARGFNNGIGNKLLVLIDGRAIYTPFYSGVFWDQQDVALDDIERIEVISGPGGTQWGTNAVNGVINVVTRPAAHDDRAGLVMLQAGEHGGVVALRAAGNLGDDGGWRLDAQRSRWSDTERAGGATSGDSGWREQLGWRTDLGAAGGRLTLQGQAYQGGYDERRFGALPLGRVEFSGAHLRARWARSQPDGGELRVQAYLDRDRRDDPLLWRPSIDTADLEFGQDRVFEGHHLSWGGGHRRSRDDIAPGLLFGFQPRERTLAWTHLFVQDRIPLGPRTDLDLGLRLEHNRYTGLETLPNLRLGRQFDGGHFVWAALSRAVRAPARLDRDITLPPQPPFIIAGGPDFQAEVANVAQLGYRGQPSARLSLSATAFLHDWQRLRSGQRPPNAQVQNMIAGHTQGLEGWGEWQALPVLRLSLGFVLLRHELRVQPGSTDPTGPSALGNDPRRQWKLRAAWDYAPAQSLDLHLRHIGALPEPAVPAYTAIDLRWSWRPMPGVEVEALVQNLLDASHPEFGAAADRAELPRHAQARLRWRW
jgi:iron complex outermembrane receptor protein